MTSAMRAWTSRWTLANALAWRLGQLPEQHSQTPKQTSILENALVQFLVYPVVLLGHDVLALHHSL